MFNHKAKKQALKYLEKTQKSYEAWVSKITQTAQELFALRVATAEEIIRACEDYINTLANSPKEFDKSVIEYKVEYQQFRDLSRQIEIEVKKQARVRKSTVGAGVATGAGVAAFGPSAAMAVATTFGTASTGTAISTLSGAAATNAALAWLGGGALTAGGAGMAGGQTLLALAGPVGWTIGSLAIVGGAALSNNQNKKAAKEATKYATQLKAEIHKLEAADKEVKALSSLTQRHADGIRSHLTKLTTEAPSDYLQFSKDQKELLGVLINSVHALSCLLKKKIA
ncbi:dna polymerase iii subunit gamma tau [Leptolyngbya sp. Heron Island J]|nr:dna polymerase iii subunit gamma tau [Leptolyngbya sp. Heron Island J]